MSLIIGAKRYKPEEKKKAKVPNKAVGAKDGILLRAQKALAAIVKSRTASANVFSARARQRAMVEKSSGDRTPTPLIARTTSAHPDNVAGLNRPYIQVLKNSKDLQQYLVKVKGITNYYDTFIINSVNVIDTEKLDIVETFGNPHFFASGRFVKKAVFSGVVRSQARTPVLSGSAMWGLTGQVAKIVEPRNNVSDYVVFRNFYENYLRATLQAASNTYTRVYVDGDYYDGYVQNLSFNISAESEQTIPWSMSMLLIRSWNAEDAKAKTYLSSFMDELKSVREVLTDREALAEIQDFQGTGELEKIGSPKSLKFVNGKSSETFTGFSISIKEAAMGVIKATVNGAPPDSVSLVTKEGKELEGITIAKGDKIPVHLKVMRIDLLTAWFISSKAAAVEFTLSVNNNKTKAISLSVPLVLEGGDSLVITKAKFVTTEGEFAETSFDYIGDPGKTAVVSIKVPKDNFGDVVQAGKISGSYHITFSNSAGNGLRLTDIPGNAYSLKPVAPIPSTKNGQTPSDERLSLSTMIVGTADSYGLADPLQSNLVFDVTTAASDILTPERIKEIKYSETLVYPIDCEFNFPGFAKQKARINTVLQIGTPAALKNVIEGEPTASMIGKVLIIKLPIAKHAYVDGKLPSPTMEMLANTVVEVTLESNTARLEGQVSLARGAKLTCTSSGNQRYQEGAVSTASNVLDGGVESGIYQFQANLKFYDTLEGDTKTLTYGEAIRIISAKAKLITNPFTAKTK